MYRVKRSIFYGLAAFAVSLLSSQPRVWLPLRGFLFRTWTSYWDSRGCLWSVPSCGSFAAFPENATPQRVGLAALWRTVLCRTENRIPLYRQRGQKAPRVGLCLLFLPHLTAGYAASPFPQKNLSRTSTGSSHIRVASQKNKNDHPKRIYPRKQTMHSPRTISRKICCLLLEVTRHFRRESMWFLCRARSPT